MDEIDERAKQIVCRLVSGNREYFDARLPTRPDWQADIEYVAAELRRS